MLQETASSNGRRRFIDVHCHFFNARDIALSGLIRHVALKGLLKYPRAIGGTAYSLSKAALDGFRSLLVALCWRLVQRPASNVREEVDWLAIADPGLFRIEAARALRLSRPQRFLKFGNPIGRILYWRKLLSSRRWNLFQAYLSLYNDDQHRLVLTTPAIVDFDYWLADHTTSPISDQVDLMEALALRSPVPMHGFVPFDPARNIHERGVSFALVKRAIETQGFIGVKLYPPMGYRAARNREVDFPDHASFGLSRFGERVDEELFALYRWCEAEEIPILTHTTATIGAEYNYESRASPEYWQSVLDRFPELRVNLAHFGHFRQSKRSGYELTSYPESWEDIISALMRNFPNVYADLSYLIWIMSNTPSSRARKVRGLFARFLNETPNAGQRFLYGTDWSFILHAAGFERYLLRMESFLMELGFDQNSLDDIYCGNALRFLGLEPGAKNWQRLDEYYRKRNLPPPAFL